MTISCDNGDFSVFDLESILSLGVRVEGSVPLSVVYTRELAKRKFLYIFVKKDADHSKPSGCKVLVVARRPHVSCPVPVVVLDRPIVLNSADHQALQLTESNILEVVYGMQSPVTLFTMVACVVSTVVLFCGVGSGHFVLLLFRKKLPSKGSLRQARRSLREEMLLEKRKWDNPTSYLEAGPDGPYYKLYNFKATEALDSVDLKNVKIAGTLKYKDKKLQIMFGHVKRVFLQPNGPEKMCDVWIQASSGMYLLSYIEVDPTYKDDFEAVVMPKVTMISDDGEGIIDKKTKNILEGEDSTGDINGEGKIVSDEESVAAITCDEIISTGVESTGTWEETRISIMSDDGD